MQQPSTESPPIGIRDATDSDLPFILSSWCKSYERHCRAHHPAAWWGYAGKFDRYNARLSESGDNHRQRDASAVNHYKTNQERVAKSLLAACGARVAHAIENPGQIIGWICGASEAPWSASQSIVHFAYVKRVFRHVGVGRALLRDLAGEDPSAIVCSHWPYDAERHKGLLRWPLSYDPYCVVKYGIDPGADFEIGSRSGGPVEVLRGGDSGRQGSSREVAAEGRRLADH